MFDDIRECPVCGRKFKVENCGDQYPGGKESEEIFCPYEGCGHLCGHMMTSGFVRTYPVE